MELAVATVPELVVITVSELTVTSVSGIAVITVSTLVVEMAESRFATSEDSHAGSHDVARIKRNCFFQVWFTLEKAVNWFTFIKNSLLPILGSGITRATFKLTRQHKSTHVM